jgi:pectin methylesterase-like acyl-CoA thioesterase
MPVAGIYDDASIAGNWLISLATLDQASPSSTSRDFLVAAKLADGVTPEQGDAAIDTAMQPFPQ